MAQPSALSPLSRHRPWTSFLAHYVSLPMVGTPSFPASWSASTGTAGMMCADRAEDTVPDNKWELVSVITKKWCASRTSHLVPGAEVHVAWGPGSIEHGRGGKSITRPPFYALAAWHLGGRGRVRVRHGGRLTARLWQSDTLAGWIVKGVRKGGGQRGRQPSWPVFQGTAVRTSTLARRRWGTCCPEAELRHRYVYMFLLALFLSRFWAGIMRQLRYSRYNRAMYLARSYLRTHVSPYSRTLVPSYLRTLVLLYPRT